MSRANDETYAPEIVKSGLYRIAYSNEKTQFVKQHTPCSHWLPSSQSFLVAHGPPLVCTPSLPTSQMAPRWLKTRTRWFTGSANNRKGQ